MNNLPRRVALFLGPLGPVLGSVLIAKSIVDGPDVTAFLALVPYLGASILAVLGWRKEKIWMTLGSGIWLVGTMTLISVFLKWWS